MKIDHFREMQLLHEVGQNPSVTQRDLGRRIGLALGMINHRLRRLAEAGCIEILEMEGNRIQYHLTEKGLTERNRLVSEYLDHCMRYYRQVREQLHEKLSAFLQQGESRFALWGMGEIAEAAFLTIQEVGGTLVGVFGNSETKRSFFQVPVQPWDRIADTEFDRVIIAGSEGREEEDRRLRSFGVSSDKILRLSEEVPYLPKADLHNGFAPVSSSWQPEPALTDVVILCGGRGTRLKSLTAGTPKPLLRVADEPFLLRLMRRLKDGGFQRFVLAAHYLPGQFHTFAQVHQKEFPGMKVVVEPQPLGTGGALRHAVESVLTPAFLALNGDSWVEQEMGPLLREHSRHERDFTVVAVRADRVQGEALKKGVWKIGAEGQIVGFETQENAREGWVNAGCYVLNRSMVTCWPVGSYSLEANLMTLLQGRRSGVFCSPGRLLDIGTPETYASSREILGVIS